MVLETKILSENYDHIAPDSSEIRLLPRVRFGGLCHCTLPTSKTSHAVRHKTVDEVWYFLSGVGEVWRKYEGKDEVTRVEAGTALNIPVGTCFQFRNIGAMPLKFICATMPAWPGPEEAEPVKGMWD